MLYTQLGKLTQNAYIDRFIRTARQEWLELNLFEDIEHAQLLATQWQWTYNNVRQHSTFNIQHSTFNIQHSAIGGFPPR